MFVIQLAAVPHDTSKIASLEMSIKIGTADQVASSLAPDASQSGSFDAPAGTAIHAEAFYLGTNGVKSANLAVLDDVIPTPTPPDTTPPPDVAALSLAQI